MTAEERIRARIRRILNQRKLHLTPDLAHQIENQLVEMLYDLGHADARGNREAKKVAFARALDQVLHTSRGKNPKHNTGALGR